MNRIILFLTMFVFLSSMAFSQEEVFRGRVVVESINIPISFANISATDEYGNVVDTRSNATGEFSVHGMKSRFKLVISSLNYVSDTLYIPLGHIPLFFELKHQNSRTISSAGLGSHTIYHDLDEITVVSQKRPYRIREGDYGGIMITLNPETQGAFPNVFSLLKRIPGVEVTEEGILIRGAASIYSGVEPLIMYDGVEYLGGVADVDPMEIHSIEVVKPGAGTTIYGTKAVNGLIIIRTRADVQSKLFGNRK